jgi:hypothetical protein
MLIADAALIVLGLVVFEVVNSIDNAIVNAGILKTMGQLWRRRFLLIGILTSVFLVRFLLPLFIVWVSTPNASLPTLFGSFVGANNLAETAIVGQKAIILTFGAVFLIYLYMHWLFLEKKTPLFIERYFKAKHGVWFFAFAAFILVIVMVLARNNPLMMLSAAIGSATFFLLYGLKETAEANQQENQNPQLNDLSKFLYLEILDAAFSFARCRLVCFYHKPNFDFYWPSHRCSCG